VPCFDWVCPSAKHPWTLLPSPEYSCFRRDYTIKCWKVVRLLVRETVWTGLDACSTYQISSPRFCSNSRHAHQHTTDIRHFSRNSQTCYHSSSNKNTSQVHTDRYTISHPSRCSSTGSPIDKSQTSHNLLPPMRFGFRWHRTGTWCCFYYRPTPSWFQWCLRQRQPCHPLQILQHQFGITSTALFWLTSFSCSYNVFIADFQNF